MFGLYLGLGGGKVYEAWDTFFGVWDAGLDFSIMFAL